MKYYLFIDDTSFRKGTSSLVLNNEKVSMVSCLIPENHYPKVQSELSQLLNRLENDYQVDEFHFTDLYNRNGKFKGKDVDPNDTLLYIYRFASMVRKYNIKIITQTITEELTNQNPLLISFIDKIADNLSLPKDNLAQNEARGLILNIIRAKKYINENDNGEILEVHCDEGLRKAGTQVELPGLFQNSLPIFFNSSAKDTPLQIADFVAWSLSRTKQTLAKSQNSKMKEFEEQVLSILSCIVNNYVNIDKVETNTENGINIDTTYTKIIKNKK